MKFETKPLVSIIITTKNSARTIGKLLKSIKDQSYRRIEIILVDNKSSDNTVGLTKKYTKLVFQKGPERSAQRNFGAKKSSGDYLLFIDSDMVLTKDVVKECVEKITKEKLLGAIVVPEKSFGNGFWTQAKIFEREINEGEDYLEAARFFPKKIFEQFNGYDESLTGPEDWDLPQKILKKYKISRIRSLIFHDEGSHTLLGLARKKYYYGLSAHRYLKNQKMNIINPRIIYFLRPSFYRNWKKLLSHPIQTIGMLIMLSAETVGGGLGYLVGRFRRI